MIKIRVDQLVLLLIKYAVDNIYPSNANISLPVNESRRSDRRIIESIPSR